MGKLIYITGPVRSGKSRRAVEMAGAWGEAVVFVGTWRPTGSDAEMSERVRRHRRERPNWRTLEAPANPAGELERLHPAPSGVVFDCLTLWLGERHLQGEERVLAEWTEQLERFKAAPWPVIVVGNEIGWSLVPADRDSRLFRDLAGTLAQKTAALADEAWLMVSGCGLRLK